MLLTAFGAIVLAGAVVGFIVGLKSGLILSWALCKDLLRSAKRSRTKGNSRKTDD
jgi:H+/gluconate symporter-like permease